MFNRPVSGQMQAFIYVQGYFHERIMLCPIATKLSEYFRYLICKLGVTIQLPMQEMIDHL